MSRLDFFDLHEFDADVPFVMLFGKVHDDSRGPLRFQYEAVWAEIHRAAAQPRFGAGIAHEEHLHLAQGAITLQQLADTMRRFRRKAQDLDLPAPPELSRAQKQNLADSGRFRQEFLDRINERWRSLLLARASSSRVLAPDMDGRRSDGEVDGKGEARRKVKCPHRDDPGGAGESDEEDSSEDEHW